MLLGTVSCSPHSLDYLFILGQDVMASSGARECSGWILGKISSLKERRVVMQWPRLPREVVDSVPRGVQELWRCGTEGNDQWGWVGVGLGDLRGLFQP